MIQHKVIHQKKCGKWLKKDLCTKLYTLSTIFYVNQRVSLVYSLRTGVLDSSNKNDLPTKKEEILVDRHNVKNILKIS